MADGARYDRYDDDLDPDKRVIAALSVFLLGVLGALVWMGMHQNSINAIRDEQRLALSVVYGAHFAADDLWAKNFFVCVGSQLEPDINAISGCLQRTQVVADTFGETDAYNAFRAELIDTGILNDPLFVQ